jgi:DNA polymerase
MSKEELQQLVRGFRSTLEALQSSGAYGVSGLPSERIPGEAPAEAAGEPVGRSLADVRQELGDCQRCPLSEKRKQIVFGCGDERAELMFVGEAPGAEEDKRGEPFVGPAGQLLDKMIVAMGWTRESVYIANVLKCRPPNNRDPRTEEVAACENFLAQQIQVIQPAAIVTLGKPAAHLLLKTSASMGSLRGIWQDYSGIPVMPTYHPAYLLRDPSKKREVWADLQQVMKIFE